MLDVVSENGRHGESTAHFKHRFCIECSNQNGSFEGRRRVRKEARNHLVALLQLLFSQRVVSLQVAEMRDALVHRSRLHRGERVKQGSDVFLVRIVDQRRGNVVVGTQLVEKEVENVVGGKTNPQCFHSLRLVMISNESETCDDASTGHAFIVVVNHRTNAGIVVLVHFEEVHQIGLSLVLHFRALVCRRTTLPLNERQQRFLSDSSTR